MAASLASEVFQEHCAVSVEERRALYGTVKQQEAPPQFLEWLEQNLDTDERVWATQMAAGLSAVAAGPPAPPGPAPRPQPQLPLPQSPEEAAPTALQPPTPGQVSAPPTPGSQIGRQGTLVQTIGRRKRGQPEHIWVLSWDAAQSGAHGEDRAQFVRPNELEETEGAWQAFASKDPKHKCRQCESFAKTNTCRYGAGC
eukprot:385234_1